MKRKAAKKPARKQTSGKNDKNKKKTRRAKPVAKPKRSTKAKSRATRPRAVKKKRVAPARRRARPAAPRRARMAAAPPATDNLHAQVVAQLTLRGYDASRPAVAAVLSAIARGYGAGPGSAPPSLQFRADQLLADAVVERYETGDRSPDPDRISHRPQVGAMVDGTLEQLGLPEAGAAEREVLTTFCLGCWEPGMMTNAERNGIPTVVVPWYRAGR